MKKLTKNAIELLNNRIGDCWFPNKHHYYPEEPILTTAAASSQPEVATTCLSVAVCKWSWWREIA